jgi:aminomethyltransferase
VLSRGIAMALLDTQADVTAGQELVIDVRGRPVGAEVVALPFVPAGRAHVATGGTS